MLNLSTHQLNVFLTAAETLNFTQAAQRLQISQPSVSQHIQALERHFNLPLFVRSGRNIGLTEAGVALMPVAREIVLLTSHLEETMASLKGEVQGHLIVGCSTTSSRYILPRLLASFHCLHPEVRTSCLAVPPAALIEILNEGKAQIAVTSEPPSTEEVEFRKYVCEKVILIVNPGHPWAQRAHIRMDELLESEIILPEENSETYAVIREELAHQGYSIAQLKPLISLNSLEAIAFSVQEGLGVAFVPETVAERLVKNQVVAVEVENLNIQKDIYIGQNVRRPATVAQAAFWQYLWNE